jgi:RNA polymerase sigma-70 factor (ECF subfamily)
LTKIEAGGKYMQGISLAPHADSGELAVQIENVEEAGLISALRDGDEQAFVRLVATHHLAMIHTALLYVATPAIAEEVAQETWLEVFRGLAGFGARSSLKTWIFRILTNIAKTRGQQESRSVVFSALAGPENEAEEPAVPPDRFHAGGPWMGGWRTAPREWADLPEERVLRQEIRARIADAIKELAPQQRVVISLRDVSGWTAEEVCTVLDISAANQRVLLHRARARVRTILEAYFTREQPSSSTMA